MKARIRLLPEWLGALLGRPGILSACLSAAAGAQDLPVPGYGKISLQIPSPWMELSRQTPAGRPPFLALEHMGNPRGSLEMTVLWSPKKDPAFARENAIRIRLMAGQKLIRNQTMERFLPLQPIQGTAGQGFFYVATDRTYKLPASGVHVPGEYPILTHGELGLGTVVVSFTIFSDAKDDAAVKEALEALRGATLVGEGR